MPYFFAHQNFQKTEVHREREKEVKKEREAINIFF